MAQVHLTNSERIAALKRLGYSEREAGFIAVAALHGGYFLRRQYCQFLSKSAGGTAASLIEKLLAKGHAKGTTFAGNTHIYHLSARPLYAALGQEDNRNRRLRQPVTIKNKLMGLDFVLQHLQHEYLATEQEKLDYFITRLGIDRAFLPVSRYGRQGQVTERYFVEKFPIFLSASTQPASPPVVSFCFVDEGEATLSAFWTFLQRYSMLFSRLRAFQLIYVAANDAHFQSAASAFGRFSAQTLGNQSAVSREPLINRLLAHFEARHLYETRQWSTFDRAKLIRYRDERQEFSGEKFNALYRHWKAAGAAAVRAILSAEFDPAVAPRAAFLTCELKENHDLFGQITTY